MRKSEEEQNIFLSICSAYDRDVLTGKEEMKKEDFERITHITMALGFIPYTQLICSLHMDLAVELEEHEEREREIYLEYPEYYDDEELDTYKGRAADDYSEEEVEQFAEVLYTMKPEEVAGWNRSLILRGINLPDQLKDEVISFLSED